VSCGFSTTSSFRSCRPFQGRRRINSFTGQACLDLANGQRNGAGGTGARRQAPHSRDRDDRGYGLPLVTTDLITPVEELVTRYARRWAIEVTFTHARQVLGVGQARNWTRQAVEPTVPFGLFCLSLVTVWYATAGHAPADVAERRSRSRWYVTKTEPSFDDMTIKLRRVIIAAKYRPQALDQVTPEETRTVLAAWAAAET
jgi:hypothetical protein